MKITVDKTIRRTLLKWLQKGIIDTDNLPILTEIRDNWFEQLLKEAGDEEKPSFTHADIDRIERLSMIVTSLKFPTREDMLKELERLEAMEREDKHGNL